MSCCCCGGASGVRYYHELRFELPWISLEPYASIYQRRCGSRSSGGVRIQVLLATKRVVLAVRQNTHGFKTHSTNNGVERFQREFFCLPFLMQRRLLRFGLYSEFQPSPLPFSPKTTGLRNELKSKQHTISGLLKLVERLSQQADETSAQETAEAQGCGWVCCRTSLFCVPLFSCFLLKSGIDFEPF